MKKNLLEELKLEAKAQGLHFQKGGVAYGSRSWTLYRGKSELAEVTDIETLRSVIDMQRQLRIKKGAK
tara:strand:+ start:1014 stop:1217 length:204 start_codon:yes stop_codon:yes gene_type:complete